MNTNRRDAVSTLKLGSLGFVQEYSSGSRRKKLHKIKSASGGAWLSEAAGSSLGTAQYSGHLPKICIERFDLAATSLRLRCSARAVHE
jgi:hypothetical protein